MSAFERRTESGSEASRIALSGGDQFPPVGPNIIGRNDTGQWKRLALNIAYLGGSVVLCLLVYAPLFLTPLFAGQTILFFRGIALAFVAAAIVAGASALLARRWRALDWTTILAATSMSLAFNLCFLTVIPVTIDRSISVFLLARIEQAGPRGLSVEQARKLFIDDYVVGMDQIGRRFDEQTKSGNIQLHDGRAVVSPQGARFLGFARAISRTMHTDPRFVNEASPDGRPSDGK
jgi:hypothetical protein